jgi:Protein of unknown function (DUF1364)
MTARLVGLPKNVTYRNQKIRDSARGKECLMALVGICAHNPEKTIWSHHKGSIAGKGRGLKADDLCGAYACTDCDAVYDGQRGPPPGLTDEEITMAWYEAHIKSIVILHADGIIK